MGIQCALTVAVPQLVAVKLGSAGRGKHAAVVVEQFSLTGFAVGGGVSCDISTVEQGRCVVEPAGAVRAGQYPPSAGPS